MEPREWNGWTEVAGAVATQQGGIMLLVSERDGGLLTLTTDQPHRTSLAVPIAVVEQAIRRLRQALPPTTSAVDAGSAPSAGGSHE